LSSFVLSGRLNLFLAVNMRDVLFQYYIDPTTWVYLSSMMAIGIFFKFRRFWSIRNLDLIGILAFGPGFLLVANDQILPGYVWLFIVGTAFAIRLLLDPAMVRRPLLEPNLSLDGLTFTVIALFFFLVASVFVIPLADINQDDSIRIDQVLQGEVTPAELIHVDMPGPGLPTFQMLATFSNRAFQTDNTHSFTPLPKRAKRRAAIDRTLVILANLAILIGIVMIGYYHFDNLHTSVAIAALYLLLPYTGQMTVRVDHIVPAALLVWMILFYRRPVLSGVCLGMAIGLICYPVFLLPLWISFYWRRGLVRFMTGIVIALSILVWSLLLISSDLNSFLTHLSQMFGRDIFTLEATNGLWSFNDPVYRIPVIVGFFIICFSMSLWPSQKNLGSLLSCSTLIMLGVLFWYSPGTGVYHMAWFLPLLLLTIFRPNLEDRVALTTVH
jgi:hypothetical protein